MRLSADLGIAPNRSQLDEISLILRIWSSLNYINAQLTLTTASKPELVSMTKNSVKSAHLHRVADTAQYNVRSIRIARDIRGCASCRQGRLMLTTPFRLFNLIKRIDVPTGHTRTFEHSRLSAALLVIQKILIASLACDQFILPAAPTSSAPPLLIGWEANVFQRSLSHLIADVAPICNSL